MSAFVLLAKPWWVNLLVLIPAIPFLVSRQENGLPRKQLFVAGCFAIAFGFVEAAVVVYLRAAAGPWPGPPANAITAFPGSLSRIECYREAATMIMLGGVSWLTGKSFYERVAAFLWMFALWDIFYYIWLRVTIGWPASFLDTDLLFLVPTPWIAQVWFPLLVSSLTALAIGLRCSKSSQ